jgi:hypothetical protein
MDAKRIAEIREWITTERELYAKFVDDENTEALHLCRARVFFLAMRDLPDLLEIAEKTVIMNCGHPQVDRRWTPKGKEFCVACEWIRADCKEKRTWEKKTKRKKK